MRRGRPRKRSRLNPVALVASDRHGDRSAEKFLSRRRLSSGLLLEESKRGLLPIGGRTESRRISKPAGEGKCAAEELESQAKPHTQLTTPRKPNPDPVGAASARNLPLGFLQLTSRASEP